MKKITVILTFVVGIITLSSSIMPALAVTEQSAFEQTNVNNILISQVEGQAHLVFNDNDQGGVTKYGLWIRGRNYVFGNSRLGINFHIYAQAEYKKVRIDERYMKVTTSYYWADTPSNFVLWQGDYSHGLSTPAEWKWSVSAGVDIGDYKMGLSASYTGSPAVGYGTANRDDGDWRYLGYFASQYYNFFFPDARFELTALLRLHLNNDMARSYYNGIFTEINSYTYQYLYITKVHFKIVCDFTQMFTIFYDQIFATHSYILGDGSPIGDLNYIPLIKGTSG